MSLKMDKIFRWLLSENLAFETKFWALLNPIQQPCEFVLLKKIFKWNIKLALSLGEPPKEPPIRVEYYSDWYYVKTSYTMSST